MASENEVQLHCDDPASAERAANAAIAEVKRIEAKYSRYLEDSVVSRINAQAGGAAVKADDETLALLAFADACYRQSDGLFDATSGVLRRAWNFKEPRVPPQAELDAILPLVGWDKVEISNAHVHLALPGMQLDFGGFGKEYAVDRAARVMADLGVSSAM
ncbi:MAG TPA: FAD:protein FMN transferase, partial [Usitatibacter sp.]|nr:FAD:protein FMN transferase [Usitatibacter sp.]